MRRKFFSRMPEKNVRRYARRNVRRYVRKGCQKRMSEDMSEKDVRRYARKVFKKMMIEKNVRRYARRNVRRLESCSIIISWFRGLSPYSFGTLFHHPFLVPGRVPGRVSLLFCHPVPSSFPGNGVLNPFRKQVCSTLIFWFWVFGHSVPSSYLQFFCLRVGFRGFSP